MPTVKVPIFESVQKGVDGIELNEENFSLVDGYKTLGGGTIARPGSKTLFTASAATGFGIDGIFYWAEKNVAMAAGGGELFQLSYTAATPVTTSLTNGSILLNQNRPVSMTVDATNVYACNGGRIIYSAVNGTPAAITSGGAPSNATHVAWLDGYILAIDGSNKLYWSSHTKPQTAQPSPHTYLHGDKLAAFANLVPPYNLIYRQHLCRTWPLHHLGRERHVSPAILFLTHFWHRYKNNR